MTTINVKIGNREETFVLIQTNAPRAYDCGAAIELYDGTHQVDGRERIERYVLIPEKQLEWQRHRNGSGLHTCNTEDVILLDEDDLAQYLWKRLYGQAA